MNKATAERWVTISALLVAGVYAYRRLTEATSQPVTLKKLVGIGNPVPLGAFATAWGFTFLVIAVMAEAAPGLGGAFAILIGTSDLLTNSSSVFGDVAKAQAGQLTAVAETSAITTGVASGLSTIGHNAVSFTGKTLTGKISNFNDSGTASGISAATHAGIAVADSSTMGGWWLIKLANGKTFVAQQIDYGPAGWTNRVFDFSAPLQAKIGNPATDSTATGQYLGKTVPAQYKNLVIS